MPIKVTEFGKAFFSKSHKGDVKYMDIVLQKKKNIIDLINVSTTLDDYIINIY